MKTLHMPDEIHKALKNRAQKENRTMTQTLKVLLTALK